MVPRVMEQLNDSGEEETISVMTVGGMQVVSGDIQAEVELIGSTSAADSVHVMLPTTAKVEEVLVSVGDFVEEGDLLLTLDRESVEDQAVQSQIGVDMAKIGVSNANASVNQAQLAYDMATSNYQMQSDSFNMAKETLADYEQLLEQGVVSQMEYDQVKLQASDETLTVLEAQLKQAEAALSQARLGVSSANASLKQAQESYSTISDLLDDMAVTAPISGYITSVNVSEKNYGSAQSAAMVIQDMSEIKVSTSVTESLITKISVDEEVIVNIEALDTAFKGIIDTKSEAASQQTLLFPITILVENMGNTIKPGMFATVTVVKEQSDNTLMVPTEAVIIRDDQHYLYIMSGDENVTRVEVATGIDNGYYTEILSGVTAEDIVITNGMGLIDESSTVKLIRSDI